MSAWVKNRHMRRNKSCPLYSQLPLQKWIFAFRHVRFALESGHVRCSAHVCFGPQADMQHKLLLFADTTLLIPANGVLKTIIAPKELSID